ncbi:hypothetical protein GOODEAATRI_012734 [Goodea atripinnis]|uniref:Uncharacterized protein n=1 Tax=Goodea atripinnis TaxID=208336 RepID=A0ABV0PY81_9TELE
MFNKLMGWLSPYSAHYEIWLVDWLTKRSVGEHLARTPVSGRPPQSRLSLFNLSVGVIDLKQLLLLRRPFSTKSLHHSLDSFLVGLSSVLRLSSVSSVLVSFNSKIFPMTGSFRCSLTSLLLKCEVKGYHPCYFTLLGSLPIRHMGLNVHLQHATKGFPLGREALVVVPLGSGLSLQTPTVVVTAVLTSLCFGLVVLISLDLFPFTILVETDPGRAPTVCYGSQDWYHSNKEKVYKIQMKFCKNENTVCSVRHPNRRLGVGGTSPLKLHRLQLLPCQKFHLELFSFITYIHHLWMKRKNVIIILNI